MASITFKEERVCCQTVCCLIAIHGGTLLYVRNSCSAFEIGSHRPWCAIPNWIKSSLCSFNRTSFFFLVRQLLTFFGSNVIFRVCLSTPLPSIPISYHILLPPSFPSPCPFIPLFFFLSCVCKRKMQHPSSLKYIPFTLDKYTLLFFSAVIFFQLLFYFFVFL